MCIKSLTFRTKLFLKIKFHFSFAEMSPLALVGRLGVLGMTPTPYVVMNQPRVQFTGPRPPENSAKIMGM